MSWSGREAFLERWLPRFNDTDLARREADKYVSGSYAPDDTRGDAWMQRALVRDQDLAAMAADPENYAIGPSRFDVSDCSHCGGNRYVRVEVPVSDPRFGKALACPDCGGGRRSEVVSPNEPEAPARAGYWCWKCGIDQDQPAGERCPHPTWHIPNANGFVPTEGPRDHVGELTNHWRRPS